MNKSERTKQHIIETTINLIQEGADLSDLTVRMIADKSGVAIAAINYHFGSKDSMLQLSAMHLLEASIKKSLALLHAPDKKPEDALIDFILDLTAVFYENRTLTKLYLRPVFDRGDLGASEFILPVLKQIFPDETELQLKIKAVQIVIPMQFAFINDTSFSKYMGFTYDTENRQQVLDTVKQWVKNIIE